MQSLNVLMNGILVGSLEKKKDGGLMFRYAPSWLNLLSARPVSLSLHAFRYNANNAYI